MKKCNSNNNNEKEDRQKLKQRGGRLQNKITKRRDRQRERVMDKER